jgi:hypothetical protein
MGRLTTTGVALACALVAATAALAANGDPQRKHTKADMAKARAALLRATDFGSGWQATPSTSSPGNNLRCTGFEREESDLVETGRAVSPDFEKGFRYVSSFAAVYKTAAQAQTSWNRLVRPGLLDCLASLFKSGSGSGVTLTVVAKRAIPFPKLAPRTAAFRISFSASGQGSALKGAIDLILLGKDRIDAALLDLAFGQPPLADERRLAGLIAKRLS